jgi:hypothetical protein
MAEPQEAMPWEEYQTTPATGQGVVIPAAPEKPNLPSPTRETERWRVMTPNEIKKEGLQEGQRYQINEAGKIEPITSKELGESESKAIGFYQRMRSSDVQLNRLGLDPQGFSTLIAQRISPTFSRQALSDERRAQLDAMENFIAASLRLESGAAIGPAEFEKQARIFFPQPGAGQNEIETKRQQRELAILGFKAVAGEQGARRADENLRALGFVDENGLPIVQGGTATGGAPKSVGAGAFMTEQDLALQAEAQTAFDGGASLEELNAIAARYNRPAFQGLDKAIQARDSGTKGIKATVEPTGFNEAPSALQETVSGYGLGAANALTAGNLDELAPILGLDPQRVEAAKAYLRENAPISSFIGEATGGALASIPAIRGAGAALAGSRLAASAPLAGEMLYGGAYGAGEAPEGQKLTGAVIGAGGAAAGGMLANRFLPGGSGTFLGRETPQPTQSFGGPQASPETVIEAGRQFDVPVMTSDVSPPQTFMGKVSQQVGEFAPFGTAGTRRKQQEARTQAVEKLLADTGVTIDQNIAKDVVESLTQKRTADIQKYSDLKGEVIDRLNTVGDVPAPKALDAIDKLIGSLKGENMSRQLGKLISDLEDTKRSLSGPGGLRKIEDNRATIFGLKGDEALSNVKGKAEKAFSSVYNALNDDMGDFIKANGDPKDFVKWKVANTKLATMIGELEQQGLKRVLDKGDFDPDQVTKMLNSKNPQEARLLFTNLGKKGRENARLLLLQDAAKKAFNKDTKEINPQAFAKAVTGNENAFRMFFGGEDAKKVKGLTALLSATRRAQEAQFAPRTGERLVPFAAAGSFGGLGTLLGLDFASGIGLASGFGVARSLYESAPVRNLLVKIGQTSGTAQGQLINKLNQALAASAGAVTAEKVAGPEPMTFGAPAQ